MSQRQKHRGKHPQDERIFAPETIAPLREAVSDLSFLLTRSYSQDAALTIVGDHCQLTGRQRRAILRCACSDASLAYRKEHEIPFDKLSGQSLIIDGYNLLILTESMLSGGILLRGRDGCIRDMASVHGSYRTVEETVSALELIGATLMKARVDKVIWCFDKPVSNSGRLRERVQGIANEHGFDWQVEVINAVDKRVSVADEIVVTSDGWILDHARRWCNIASELLAATNAQDEVIEL